MLGPGYCSRYGWGFGVQTPVEARDFLFSTPLQTGHGVHPASCAVTFPWGGGGGEAIGAWCLSPTPSSVKLKY